MRTEPHARSQGGLGPFVGSSMGGQQQDRMRVYVRIRPLLPCESIAGQSIAWAASDDWTLKCLEDMPASGGKAVSMLNSTSAPLFFYDRVFTEAATSKEVYDTAIAQIVEQSMQGYNGTVFAYGQTVRPLHLAACMRRPSLGAEVNLRVCLP